MAGVSFYLIWLTSKVYWLLAIFVAVICLVLLAALIWYGIKYTSDFTTDKKRKEQYEETAYASYLTCPFDSNYVMSVLDKANYKSTLGEQSGYKYSLFIKKNEAADLTDYIVVRTDRIKSLIDFDCDMEQAMLVHEIQIGTARTIIIVVVSKADDNTEKLYQLNNPRNVLRKKFYCLYETSSMLVKLGCLKELASSEAFLRTNLEIERLLLTKKYEK
jgi:hypothetical protein